MQQTQCNIVCCLIVAKIVDCKPFYNDVTSILLIHPYASYSKEFSKIISFKIVTIQYLAKCKVI